MLFRKDINALRALAVILVILYHFKIPGFSGGFIGVDVFFVISGFLMTKIILSQLEKGSFSYGSFIAARFKRIFPALLVFVFILTVSGWFLLSSLDYLSFSKSAVSSLLFLSNIYYWRSSGYFDSDSHSNILLHTWSLSVEWQFYMLLPLLLWAVYRIAPRRKALTAFLWASFVVSFLLSCYFAEVRPSPAFYLLPTRAWEMIAGGLVFVSHIQMRRLTANVLAVVGVLLCLLCAVFYTGEISYPGLHAFWPVLGTVFVLLAQPSGYWVENKFLQKTGYWSYSLYLWHWPFSSWYLSQQKYDLDLLLLGLSIVSIIGLSLLSYRFVEGTRQGFSRKLITFGVVLFAAVIIGCGYIYQQEGIRSRSKGSVSDLLKIEEAMKDWGFPSSCNGLDFFGKIRPCILEGKTEDRILFVGDSHVQQWWPRVKANHEKDASMTVTFVTTGGCPPLPAVDRMAAGFACPKFWEQALAEANKPSTKTVVFGSIWVDYFVGASIDKKPRMALTQVPGARWGRSPMQSSEINEIFSSFGKIVSHLQGKGKKVFIILPIVSSVENIPRVIYDRVFFLGETSDYSVAEEFFLNRSRSVRNILTEISRETGAVLVDGNKGLCTSGICSYFDAGGDLRYMDGNHLRSKYVKEHVDFLDIIFK
ncbi:hypothetical protein AZI85_16020 [Bdellovibrio bacteriovorus]|uniref:Acyltransferase n=1 Tax=Bdellovibrio bacteriovorus TaxID=959 RepID=A0A150WTS2_BDEBC|nr:acyltransferase family protein [Bdellovibrio bacteriovorus]KYG69899.1 hypothetical protein AZI85_16020 [Bdellovibrio bacteriovorus]